MNRINRKSSILRAAALLLALLILPFSVSAEEGSLVEEQVTPHYALPIDFSAGYKPKSSGFSTAKDDKGNTIHIYEDSTIRAVISETRWFTDDPKDKVGTRIWMADVVIADPSQFRTASADVLYSRGVGDFYDDGLSGLVVKMAEKMNAVVAVNGDSWGANERSEKNYYGIVFRQGQLINSKARLDPAGKRRMDLLIVDEFGDFHGIHSAAEGSIENPYMFEGKKVLDIFAFGPILIENGEAVADFQGADRPAGDKGTWINMRATIDAQRVAICQKGPLHYMIAASANKASGKNGNFSLTLRQFTDFLATQDVQFAYNLDGGVSSVLYFPPLGKVNLHNQKQGRGLWDIIYFASAEK